MQELHDAPLAPLTTFRLGGPAARLVTASTDAEVVAAVREADAAGTPLLVIGGGSNLVIGDEGFDGTALRIATSGLRARTAAGWSWRRARSGRTPSPARSRRGWPGIECLAGIPGSAGATPIQNVGAYGQEVSGHDHRGGRLRPAPPARRHHRRAPSAASPTGTAASRREPDRYVVLRVRFALEDAGGLSAPVKYAETARARSASSRADRVPAADRPRGRAEAARGQGHGARPGGPRHLVGGVLLHQPDPDRGRARGLPRPGSASGWARTSRRPRSRRATGGSRPRRPG